MSNISDNDIDKWVPDSNFYLLNIKRIMNNPFFFPTERGLQSIFSLGKSSISNMSDSLFNQFALLDKISSNFKSETEINPLDIYYKYENNQGFIRSKISHQYFPLRNGASGYQSAIPIVLAVKYYTEIEKRKRTFIIEENYTSPTRKKVILI